MLHNRIRERLDKIGKSQGWLSREIGVDSAHVSRWVNGDGISLGNAMRVAEALGCEVSELFFWEDDEGSGEGSDDGQGEQGTSPPAGEG